MGPYVPKKMGKWNPFIDAGPSDGFQQCFGARWPCLYVYYSSMVVVSKTDARRSQKLRNNDNDAFFFAYLTYIFPKIRFYYKINN